MLALEICYSKSHVEKRDFWSSFKVWREYIFDDHQYSNSRVGKNFECIFLKWHNQKVDFSRLHYS